MATVTRYEVENVEIPNTLGAEVWYPQIARVILVDGTEVSRGYPDFKEVSAVDPAVVSKFYDAIRDHLTSISAQFDASSAFTPELYMQMIALRSSAQDFTSKYDQSDGLISEYL